jgi:hypothetical protein
LPKETIQISNFQTGIISNVSMEDIPLDAASEALNVDPTAEKGELIGLNSDEKVSDFGYLYQESAFINDDGTYHYIGWQPKLYNNTVATTNTLVSIKDAFSGSTTAITGHTGVTNGTLCSMEVNNKEVHIGLGDNPSKWFGMIQYKQFGVKNGAATFGYPALEDAEISSPKNFEDFYKVVHSDANYLYGIKWQGTYIYKLHKTNLTISKSQKRFKSLQGICIFNGSTDYIWVYDAGEGTYGTLYKYSNVLGPAEEFASTLDIPSGAIDKWKIQEISDIIHIEGTSGGHIWFQRSIEGDDLPSEDLNEGEGAWLWNATEPTSSGTLTLASKTPLFESMDGSISTTQGQWYGFNQDGIFYKDGTSFDDSAQMTFADIKAATTSSDESSIYSAATNYNRYICSGIKYTDDGLVLVYFSDRAGETSNTQSIGSSKLVVYSIDTDIDSSTFGELTETGTHNCGWAGSSHIYDGKPSTSNGPDFSVIEFDDTNKIIFVSAENFLQVHKYGDQEDDFVSSYIKHQNGKFYNKLGTSYDGEIKGIKADIENKLLFVANLKYGIRITPYESSGKLLNSSPSQITWDDGGNHCHVDIDPERKILFAGIRGDNGGKIRTATYSPAEDPYTQGTGVSTVTSGIGAQGTSYPNDQTPIFAVDTENKLLFASFVQNSVTESIVEVFSYEEDGTLSHVANGFVNGHSSYTHVSNHYNPTAEGTTNGHEQLMVKLDIDSRIVMIHKGEDIISFSYKKDGTFESTDINSMKFKTNRVTNADFNAHDSNTAGDDGLGFAVELIQAGEDSGAQTKKGVIVWGSNTGKVYSRVYARNTSKVWIPKVGLTIPQNEDDAIAIPICVNNSIQDNQAGNNIYYVGDSNDRTVKAQTYWIMVDDAIDPSATDGTETLDGTKGECIAATTNSTTAGQSKIFSVNTNLDSDIKVAYTGNESGDSDNITNLYVINTAADNNPNFSAASNTVLTPTASLKGINLKEACVVHQDDTDDQTLDLFEGAVRGTGKWARVNFDQSGGDFEHPTLGNGEPSAGGILAAPIDIKFELIAPEDEEDEEGGKGVLKDKKYFYKTSYVFDGYQEGPLGDDFVYTPNKDGNLLLTIQLKGLSALPARTSHINLYRSESDDIKSSKPLGYYRLCKSIRLDTGWTVDTISDESNPEWGFFRQYKFLDEGALFQSFESNAGFSSTLESTTLNYALSTQLNNTLFVSNIFNPILDEEGGNFMAKSLPYKYNTFDITKDILRLPEKLTAMVPFRGRIWGFSLNKFYIIEPNTFYIEEDSKGIGCIHHKSIAITPYGMFWCDEHNIYWHNGQSLLPIGEAIKSGSSYSWDTADLTELHTSAEIDVDTAGSPQPPIVVFDALKQCVLFIHKQKTTNKRIAQMFHISSQRWECVEISDHKVTDAITGPDGYMYYIVNQNNGSSDVDLNRFASDSGKRNWTFKSKEITAGQDLQNKHFHSVKFASSGNFDWSSKLTVKLDGSTVTPTYETDGSLSSKYILPYGFRKGKRLKFEIAAQSGATKLESIGITYRRKGDK